MAPFHVVALVLFAPFIIAQQCVQDNAASCSQFPQQPNGTCPPFPQLTAETEVRDFVKDHMGGASIAAPFTAAIRCQPESDREKFLEVVRWFRHNLDMVEEKQRENKGSYCNLRNHDWTKKAKGAMADRRLGVVKTACTTTHLHTVVEGRRARKLFRDVAEVYRKAGLPLSSQKRWKSKSKQGVWQKLASWSYISKADEQTCNIERATAVRLDKKWYIHAQVTNRGVDRLLGARERWFLEEWIHEDFCCPLTLWFQEYDTKEKKFVGEVKPYTTIYASWEGSADISSVYNMAYDKNRPLSRALSSNALAVDQAKDAIRPSNVAILALPLAMSFIPVALIADVNDFAAFIYVIFTDFFSAVPFVIKGIELLHTGTDTKVNAETWVVGEGNIVVSESWVASCKPRPEFKTYGILFICIGIGTILSGFALEHIARKYMRRRIAQGENPRPFGDALFAVSHPLIPRNYSDHEDAPNYAADIPAPPPTAPGPFSAIYRRFTRRRSPIPLDNGDHSHGPTLGTGAGLGAAVASGAVRGPSPRQVSRWSDERWYEHEE